MTRLLDLLEQSPMLDSMPQRAPAPWSVPELRQDRVARVLLQHREGVDGWCHGCAQAGMFTFFPCPSAQWAAQAAAEFANAATSG